MATRSAMTVQRWPPALTRGLHLDDAFRDNTTLTPRAEPNRHADQVRLDFHYARRDRHLCLIPERPVATRRAYHERPRVDVAFVPRKCELNDDGPYPRRSRVSTTNSVRWYVLAPKSLRMSEVSSAMATLVARNASPPLPATTGW